MGSTDRLFEQLFQLELTFLAHHFAPGLSLQHHCFKFTQLFNLFLAFLFHSAEFIALLALISVNILTLLFEVIFDIASLSLLILPNLLIPFLLHLALFLFD